MSVAVKNGKFVFRNVVESEAVHDGPRCLKCEAPLDRVYVELGYHGNCAPDDVRQKYVLSRSRAAESREGKSEDIKGVSGSLSGARVFSAVRPSLLALPRGGSEAERNGLISVECSHRFKFVGSLGSLSDNYVKGPKLRGLARSWNLDRCVNPIVLFCQDCELHILKPCGSADNTVCAPCEMVYRKRVRTIVREPALIAKPGSLSLLTLTGPGSKLHCLTHTYRSKDRSGAFVPRPSVKCNFDVDSPSTLWDEHEICPCSTADKLLDTPERIQSWNVSAIARFNDFITDLRRSVLGFENVEYFKAVEPQKRGVIHLHIVLRAERLIIITSEMREQILKYAIAHGFGHEVDFQLIANGKDDADSILKAARYVAKYVTKTNAEAKAAILLPTIPNTVEVEYFAVEPEGDVLTKVRHVPLKMGRRRRIRYRAWSASRGWGLSLGKVKTLQRLWTTDRPQYDLAMLDWQFTVEEHQYTPPD